MRITRTLAAFGAQIVLLLVVVLEPVGAQEATRFKGVGPRGDRIPVELQVNKASFAIGEPMGIRVRSMTDGYLLLYYIDSAGKAQVVTPSPYSTNNRLRAGQWLYVTDNGGRMLEQTGPVGSERVQALVTVDPIDFNRLKDYMAVGPSGIYEITNPDGFVTAVLGFLHNRIRTIARGFNPNILTYIASAACGIPPGITGTIVSLINAATNISARARVTVNASASVNSNQSKPQPTASPSPAAQPTASPVAVQPTPSPSPAAQPTANPVAVQPTPSPSPGVQPTASPVAVQPTPSPSPAAQPTASPVAVQPTPSPSPAAQPTASPVAVQPTPSPEPDTGMWGNPNASQPDPYAQPLMTSETGPRPNSCYYVYGLATVTYRVTPREMPRP